MSDFDSLLWRLERDPQLASGFAAISLLDRAPDHDRLRARLTSAARALPQLRCRVIEPLGHLAPAEWEEDPDFSVDHHLHHVMLPAPGDEQALCETALAFTHAPFDKTRPLWDFLVVEGLTDGRAALVQRLHHALTDGVGGVRLSERYLDLERNPAPRPERAPVPHPASPAEASRPADSTQTGIPRALDALGSLVQQRAKDVARAVGTTAHSVLAPQRWGETARTTVSSARGLPADIGLTGGRRSPLWIDRGERVALRLLSVSLDQMRDLAHARGVTVNDLFVAGAAGAAGAYHRACGHPVEELRMAMPVSTRTDRSAAGNAFGVRRVTVSTIADPAARLDAIHEQLARGRRTLGSGSLEQLAGVANLFPTALLTPIARRQLAGVDFTTSNVRGAPFDLFVAGAKLLANYPIGPLTGTAWNLTTMSYAGSLDMGLHVDVAAVDGVDLLHTCVVDAFAELLALRG